MSPSTPLVLLRLLPIMSPPAVLPETAAPPALKLREVGPEVRNFRLDFPRERQPASIMLKPRDNI